MKMLMSQGVAAFARRDSFLLIPQTLTSRGRGVRRNGKPLFLGIVEMFAALPTCRNNRLWSKQSSDWAHAQAISHNPQWPLKGPSLWDLFRRGVRNCIGPSSIAWGRP
jgi:hypothetical protein